MIGELPYGCGFWICLVSDLAVCMRVWLCGWGHDVVSVKPWVCADSWVELLYLPHLINVCVYEGVCLTH